MTEAEWLASSHPRPLLDYLLAEGKISKRKMRLYACACCSLVGTPPETLEQYERIGMDDSNSLGGVYSDKAWAKGWTERGQSKPPLIQRAAILRDLVGNPFRPYGKTRCSACAGSGRVDLILVGSGTAPCPDCDGSGWRDDWEAELTLEDWLAWQGGVIPRLAQAIYDERAFDRLPILQDALLEAGCEDEDLLRHCQGEKRCPECLGKGIAFRGEPSQGKDEWACWYCNRKGWLPLGAPHVRGCFLIDLLLGRE